MSNKKLSKIAFRTAAGVALLASTACSTVAYQPGVIDVGNTTKSEGGNPKGTYTLNLGGNCQASYRTRDNKAHFTAGQQPVEGCSAAQVRKAKTMFSKAVAKCYSGERVVNPDSMLVTVFRDKKRIFGNKDRLPLKFHPTIIHQPVGVVAMPSTGCVDYTAQAQESLSSADNSDHGHSHGDANNGNVVIVPSQETSGLSGGRIKTTCDGGPHSHLHGHKNPANGNVVENHTHPHPERVPHRHTIVNGGLTPKC